MGQICPVSQSLLTHDLKQYLRKLKNVKMGKDFTNKLKQKYDSPDICVRQGWIQDKASTELHFIVRVTV